MTRWLKNRAVVHAVIVAFFVVPMLGLLRIDPQTDSFLSQVRTQFDAWEYSTVDYRIHFGRKAPINRDIVFLTIDDSSRSISNVLDESAIKASPALSLMQSFPYPRELYALISDKLFASGARAVALDLFFPAPTPTDPAFKSAIDRYGEKFVIGMNFRNDSSGSDADHISIANVSTSSSGLTLPSFSLFPDQDPFARQLAYLNFWPDTDGIIRDTQYRTNVENVDHKIGAEKFPALYSLMAKLALDAGHADQVPNDMNSRTMRYAGPPHNSFTYYSLYEIFYPPTWETTFKNGDFFRGKIVLVGPQGNLAKDTLLTPYGEMDGAEIHLNALNALLQNEFLHRVSNLTVGVFVVASGFIAYVLALGIASIAWRFAAVLLILTGYTAGLMLAYNGPGLLLPSLAPMGLLIGMTGTGFIYDFVLAQLEKLRLRTTFERYTSPNVAKYLLDRPDAYREMLAGARKPVTVLFSDVRGFTTMSEKADSQELVAKLNEYLTAMVSCVFQYDGALDKFIGDAVMAVWGNTSYNFGPKEDAVRAVRAARAMMKELHALNAKWGKEGRTEWQIGIGLNHGEVIVGDIGSPQRKEFAVIGDQVNLASRLESLTKEYHVDILLGESVADLVRDQFHLRTVDLVVVKGKTEAVQTFTVFAEKTETLSTAQQPFLTAYEEAVANFRNRKFEEARKLLLEALKIQPGDHLATEYLDDCEAFIKNPPDASWTGIRVMTKK